jgi:uncharacterized protein
MADCYADQVVIEMPFAAGLGPKRIETTRGELRDRFGAGTAVWPYTNLNDVRIHETLDPDVLVVEYQLEGTTASDKKSFALDFVMVMSFRDGLIVRSRDYTDPVAAARAMGRLPELVATLTADTPVE